MNRHIIIIILFLIPCAMIAQSDRQLIRDGNKRYRKGEYVKAESAYRKAVAKNEKNAIATYNLGCAMMRQNNDSSAIETFANAVAMTTDKAIRSQAYHNTGTILQHKKQYKEAIEAYKGALRNNPKDKDSRYNLVLCQHLLKQQQQQQQNKQNKKQNEKDKNNDKNKENKDNKDQQNKNDKQQPKDDQKEQQPKRQMSRKNAEQLLNAAMQQEKETQKKLTKAMQQPSRKQLDKNW